MKNRRAKFQGSKANTRKQAFLEREEKRNKNKTLPVLITGAERPLVLPYNTIHVPVLNAMITPIVPDFYAEEKVPEVILLGN